MKKNIFKKINVGSETLTGFYMYAENSSCKNTPYCDETNSGCRNDGVCEKTNSGSCTNNGVCKRS